MLKILPIVVIISVVVGVSGYFIFFHNKQSSNSAKSTVQSDFSSKSVSNIDSTNEKFTFLDNALKGLVVDVSGLQAQFNSYTASTNARLDTDEAKINSLQSSVNNLNNQVNSLQKSSPTASPQGGSPSVPVYIPLGSGGSQGDRNYLSVNGYNVAINPSNYSGYTNMVLQVNANLVQSVGTANFQLYNATTNQAVSGSQVSTTSSNNTFMTSGGFTLPAGNNTYQLQAQSTEGYTIQIQNATIMVNF